MGFQGSNFEPGLVPESGSLAGAGSYVGVNADGDFVLTSSAGGSGGSTSPGSPATSVQFNDGGSFAGDSGFTFEKNSNTVMITGSLRLTGSEAGILVIEKAPGDNTKEIVFVEEGTEQGGIYFNSTDNFFIRNENDGKDIILRVENASNTGRNLIRAAGTSEGVIVGFTNNKTTANEILDVDGNVVITGSLKLTDDEKLLFGDQDDASIEYDEDGINKLIISGSVSGLELMGGKISVDYPGNAVTSGTLGGAGSYLGLDSSHNLVLASAGGGTPAGADTQIQFNDGGSSFGASAGLTWDDTNLAATRAIFGTTVATLTVAAGELSTLSSMDSGSNKYTTQYDAIGKLQGHVLSLGGSTTVANKLYFLSSSGGFFAAQANDDDTGGNQLLGIALGTNSTNNGILRRGTVRVTGSVVDDEMVIGAPVYVSKTTAGNYQFATPSGSGEYVRQVGYCLDVNVVSGDDADMLLLFEPSDTFIEIA